MECQFDGVCFHAVKGDNEIVCTPSVEEFVGAIQRENGFTEETATRLSTDLVLSWAGDVLSEEFDYLDLSIENTQVKSRLLEFFSRIRQSAINFASKFRADSERIRAETDNLKVELQNLRVNHTTAIALLREDYEARLSSLRVSLDERGALISSLKERIGTAASEMERVLTSLSFALPGVGKVLGILK